MVCYEHSIDFVSSLGNDPASHQIQRPDPAMTIFTKGAEVPDGAGWGNHKKMQNFVVNDWRITGQFCSNFVNFYRKSYNKYR